MKLIAIVLCITAIRYSFAGLVECFSRNENVWDAFEWSAGNESRVLDSLEKFNSVPTEILDQYKAAMTLERKMVREYILSMKKTKDENKRCHHLYKLYADLINNTAGNGEAEIREVRERHGKLFASPSAAQDKYFAMKRKENATFHDFFERGGPDLYEEPTRNEFESLGPADNEIKESEEQASGLVECFFRNENVWDAFEWSAGNESRVLDELEKFNSVPTDILDQYKAAMTLERKMVREYILSMEKNKDKDKRCRHLYKLYTGLINNTAGNGEVEIREIRERHGKFFATPSAAQDKYFAMKRKENATFHDFFKRGGPDLYEKPTRNEFESLGPEDNEIKESVEHAGGLVECFFRNENVWDAFEWSAGNESRVLDELEKFNSVPTDILDQYKAAMTLERKMVREYILSMEKTKDKRCRHLYKLYTGLINNTAGNGEVEIREVRQRHSKFFATPSAAQDKYFAMKRKENATFHDFFKRGGPDLYEKSTGNEFEESAKPDFDFEESAGHRKRDSGSRASQMHAEVFVIFLCMGIGIFVVDRQWMQMDDEDLRAKKKAGQVKKRLSWIESDQMRGDII